MSESHFSSNVAAEPILATVASLAAAQLPLSEGLRAAASEARGRVASGLLTIAEQLEQGRTLEQVCSDPRLQLPSHLRGMVAAAARTGQLGPALDELLQYQRSIRSMLWQIWGSLAYPMIALLLNSVLIGFLLYWVVPVFKTMFEEMELQLPASTEAIISLSDACVWMLSGPGNTALVLAGVIGLLLLFCASTGRGGVLLQRWIIESIPLLGPLFQWSGAASFFYLLGALLDKNIPLVEALRLTADGTKKADLRQSGLWLANQVSGGHTLSDSIQTSGCLPVSAVPLLRWGERNQALPEALRMLSELHLDRVRLRAEWLRSVAPPFVYVFIGLSAVGVIVALFMPLVTLVVSLT